MPVLELFLLREHDVSVLTGVFFVCVSKDNMHEAHIQVFIFLHIARNISPAFLEHFHPGKLFAYVQLCNMCAYVLAFNLDKQLR